MRFVGIALLVVGVSLVTYAFGGLARDVRKLMAWKRQIEGDTEFSDRLIVFKQEWDDFRKYVYVFEWDHNDRLKKLESARPIYRQIVPSKWKPWVR